jgi:hypothetical protein
LERTHETRTGDTEFFELSLERLILEKCDLNGGVGIDRLRQQLTDALISGRGSIVSLPSDILL